MVIIAKQPHWRFGFRPIRRQAGGRPGPISTSIFARIAAEAALEEIETGVPLSEVTPFWRVIDEKGPIAKKLSCGVDMLRAQREREQART